MFGTRILTRFLMRRFLAGVGLVMLVVCGIIFAITFVERLPSNPTIVAAVSESWMRLLEYVPMFLPLAVFMGTLLAYYNLLRASESVIVSSAGASPYQVARPFLVGAAAIGFFATMVVNPYSVRLSTRNITTDHLKLVDGAIWLRETGDDGFLTMRARTMRRDNNNLVFGNATILIQDREFHLTRRVVADSVTLGDGTFDSNRAVVCDSDGILRTDTWHYETRLSPQTILDRYLQPDQISFWALPSFIQKMRAVGVPVRGHLVQLWTLVFLPLTLIAMTVLGAAFSQTRQRRNFSFGAKFGIGIITCFALYFTINMFNALGANGTLPPMLAIIAPPLIIIAAAGAFIASFDTI
ncbi:MAG: LptF/LptG family permease [Alphaproteobacteria bacterium]|nr:LptF/LptG family permease [Alphaproteobacteria bacterium]